MTARLQTLGTQHHNWRSSKEGAHSKVPDPRCSVQWATMMRNTGVLTTGFTVRGGTHIGPNMRAQDPLASSEPQRSERTGSQSGAADRGQPRASCCHQCLLRRLLSMGTILCHHTCPLHAQAPTGMSTAMPYQCTRTEPLLRCHSLTLESGRVRVMQCSQQHRSGLCMAEDGQRCSRCAHRRYQRHASDRKAQGCAAGLHRHRLHRSVRWLGRVWS